MLHWIPFSRQPGPSKTGQQKQGASQFHLSHENVNGIPLNLL
jgi:hypothetical protein